MELEEIKLKFIAEALQTYMQEVMEAMQSSMQQKHTLDTHTLYNSLKQRTYQQYAQGNANLSFAEWGRFLDMGVSKGHPLGGIKATAQKLRKNDTPSRKPRKIYSPIVYGHLNGLINQIAYGFTEETISRIKNNIET